MLGALASLAVRHPRRMVLLALVVFAVAGVFGSTAIGLLNARNPKVQRPELGRARAEALIERALGAEPSPGVLALVSAPPGSPAVASAAQTIARVPGVAAVTAPVPGHNAGRSPPTGAHRSWSPRCEPRPTRTPCLGYRNGPARPV